MAPAKISFYDCTEDGRWLYCEASCSKERTAVYNIKNQRWYWYMRKADEVYKMLEQGATQEELAGPDNKYLARICVAHDLFSIKEMYDWLVGGEAQLA